MRSERQRTTASVARRTAQHRQALVTSGQLTLVYRQMYEPMAAMITPLDVVKVLNKAKVGFVLMGTHGVGGYRDQARATEDVDILVRRVDLKKAISALGAAFPNLTCEDHTAVTRFLDPATGKPVIDLMKPVQPVFQMAFREAVKVGDYRIPNLEMALVSKFAAMTSPNRAYDKKLIDAGDFVNIVMTNQRKINRARLGRLADKVYPDGGKDIVQMVENIAAGKPIQF